MSDDYNSIINGQDDYTNRIVSAKSKADAGQIDTNNGVSLALGLELRGASIHPGNDHKQLNNSDYNIPAPRQGKDPYSK